jgi:hypothetical protein
MAMTNALDRTANKLARNESSSLMARIKRQSNEDRIVLSDTSGSMSGPAGNSEKRKIDALRDVIYDLKAQGYAFKHIVFGSSVELREDIPEPDGGTPLTEALNMARQHNPGRVIVISDGVPDSPGSALDAARELGCPIDCFYVGPTPSSGEVFMAQLADLTKGSSHVGDLGKGVKALEGEIKKALLALPAAIQL